MGFFNKIKDILFEEVDEEETTPKKEKKEAPREEKKPIAEKIEPQRKVEEMPPLRETRPVEPPKREVATPQINNTVNERDLFKSENTFNFPDFDEEEFSSSMSRLEKPRPKPTTNVIEYEKKKKVEKKYDLGRYERVEKTEITEKKKFRPSPIISPVYGILNEDYRIEDIKNKNEVSNNSNTLDFNSVRKKAFGSIERLTEEPKETLYEETVTVKLKENNEVKEQKVKAIDELLEDTADVAIDVTDNKEEYQMIDNDLEDLSVPEKVEKKSEPVEKDDNEDTLETDLFDLIDSMYDNREDGDE